MATRRRFTAVLSSSRKKGGESSPWRSPPGSGGVRDRTDFKIGHLQANPFVPGLILFCWETGGDAPQRTWLVRSDGSEKRPFYKETFNEWVTHEVWWKPDRGCSPSGPTMTNTEKHRMASPARIWRPVN